MRNLAVSFLVAVSFLAPRIWAGIRPSFGLDHCTWHATHIVIASEGDEIDGSLTVLESWKGDLQPGEVISIPQLASFKSQPSREVKSSPLGPAIEQSLKYVAPKKYVTGARMILFLKKKEQSPEASTNSAGSLQAPGNALDLWEPASRDGINVSVLWIEEGRAFAFIQVMNPGDSILTHYHPSIYSRNDNEPSGDSEKEIRDRVFEVMQIQDQANDAVTIRDQWMRAAALAPLASSALYYARDLAFTELQKCGKAALPVLRQMLSDQTVLRLHPEVLKSLAAAGGDEVADEITAVVREELAFWQETGPRLKNGWWNTINEPETEVLRDRYGKVLQALYCLTKLKPVGCKEVVIEFRDFWRSLPPLGDKRGLDQMSEACDVVLRSLP